MRMIHRRDAEDAEKNETRRATEKEPVSCRAGCAGPEDGEASTHRAAEKRAVFSDQQIVSNPEPLCLPLGGWG